MMAPLPGARLAALTAPAPARTRLPFRSARRAVTGPPATEAMPDTATAIPAAVKLPVRWRNSSRIVSGVIVCAMRPMDKGPRQSPAPDRAH